MFTISTDQRSILINIHIYTYIHAHTYTQKMCIYIAFLLFLLLFSDQQRFFFICSDSNDALWYWEGHVENSQRAYSCTIRRLINSWTKNTYWLTSADLQQFHTTHLIGFLHTSWLFPQCHYMIDRAVRWLKKFIFLFTGFVIN